MNQVARRLLLIGVATIALLALAACSGDKPAVPLVSVSGVDYSFDAPEAIAGGRTTIRFANKGSETHELQLMRLNDGVPMHQFQQALHEEGLGALQMVTAAGHVAHLGPGETAEATVELPAGEYVLICLIASPDDGAVHAVKGMVKRLTVTAAM